MCAKRLRKEVEHIAVLGLGRPTSISLENRRQTILAAHLLDKRLKLSRMMRRKAAIRQRLQPFIADLLAISMQRIAQHMPRTRRRKWLLVLGWLAPEVIWPGLNIFQHQRVNIVVICPVQPISVGYLQMHMHHTVEQGRRHWLHNRAILAAVTRANHDRTFGQHIFANAPLVNQTIKRLLHLMRTCIQFIQKQAIRLFPRNHLRRAKAAHPIFNLGHTNDILWRKLAAQQRYTRQADLRGKLLHQGRFADAWRPPVKDGAHHRDIEQELSKLLLSYSSWRVHPISVPD